MSCNAGHKIIVIGHKWSSFTISIRFNYSFCLSERNNLVITAKRSRPNEIGHWKGGKKRCGEGKGSRNTVIVLVISDNIPYL